MAGAGHGDFTVFGIAVAMGVVTVILLVGALIVFLSRFNWKG